MNNKINNSKIISELSNIKCFLNDCSYNWDKNKKRIIYNNGNCIDDCKNDKINMNMNIFVMKNVQKELILLKIINIYVMKIMKNA
jgi:hypothetical protein